MACHADESSLLLDSAHENKLVLGSASGNNLAPLLCLIESLSSLKELNSEVLLDWVPNLLNLADLLSESLSADDNSLIIHFFLVDDASLVGNLSAGFNMVSAHHSHVHLLANVELLLIIEFILAYTAELLAELDQLDAAHGILSDLILKSECCNVYQTALDLFSKAICLHIVVVALHQVLELFWMELLVSE